MSDSTISVPVTVTDYIGTYQKLSQAGDADHNSHLIEWLEDQLLTVRPRDVGEFKAKMDVLLDWVNPGISGMSEKGTDLLVTQVNSLRADLLALRDLGM
ncbi:hypothetical protein [Thalassospira sp. UBA1131]|jgi:hypothetical protein|uniref:hypothetical protein n=1 Tax=Thalassospira sp. UBA1131 TaxID=1947672 RepID=UPI0025F6777A|nr:hypothetical protein [Thalassospira sp. UBA1131]